MLRCGIGIIAFYTLLAATAFVLQWIPITGVFLMIFGGALIIGALIHLCLLHLSVVALRRRISHAWLILPVTYYAGGYCMHLVSVRRAAETAAAIEKANSKQHAQVAQPFTYLSSSFDSLELLQRFRIEAAYSKNRAQTGIEYGQYRYTKGLDCDKGASGFYYAERYTQPFLWRRDLFPSYSGADKTRQCILLQTIREAHPDYEIREMSDNAGSTFLYRQFIERWSALDLKTNQVVASVRVGLLTPLPIVQFLIAGCALNDGASTWDCGAALMLESDAVFVGYKKRTDNGNPFIPVVDADTSPAAALGHALGLAPRTPVD